MDNKNLSAKKKDETTICRSTSHTYKRKHQSTFDCTNISDIGQNGTTLKRTKTIGGVCNTCINEQLDVQNTIGGANKNTIESKSSETIIKLSRLRKLKSTKNLQRNKSTSLNSDTPNVMLHNNVILNNGDKQDQQQQQESPSLISFLLDTNVITPNNTSINIQTTMVSNQTKSALSPLGQNNTSINVNKLKTTTTVDVDLKKVLTYDSQLHDENLQININSNTNCTSTITQTSEIDIQIKSNVNKLESTQNETINAKIINLKRNSLNLSLTNSINIPLPQLNWALNNDLWKLMKDKENSYTLDCTYLRKHAGIEPHMRAILLDWLVEICYEYRLHRETFHLAVEYIDRFLTIKENMKVDRLQLIGMTALFLAAKAEEIYPPKLNEFAAHMENYSDNNEEAIMQFELFMLKSLNWQISPLTANTWLNMYLQIANVNHINNDLCTNTANDNIRVLNTRFLLPQYSKTDYMKSITLIDLCLFDIDSMKFKYSQLAACAMYYMVEPNDLAFRVSGYKYTDLDMCINWMCPYADVVKEFHENIQIRYFNSIDHDDAHNIQLYYKNLDLWKEAQSRKTPSKIQTPLGLNTNTDLIDAANLLTPPDSNKKKK